MPPKLVHSSRIIHIKCPHCDKEVDALRIDNSNFIEDYSKPPYQRYIMLLGCTECKSVFYKLEPE